LATCVVVFAGLTDLLPDAPVALTVGPFEGDVLVIVGFPAPAGFEAGFAASLAVTANATASGTRIVSRRMMPPLASANSQLACPGLPDL
jgi:hypothetical protein